MQRNVDVEIELVRSELAQVRKDRQDELLQHNLGMEVLRIKGAEMKKAFQISVAENTGKRSPLHRYVEAARRARGAEHAIPTYVLSMEGQLCRSMHHMLVFESDLSLHREQCAEVADWMKKSAATIGDTKVAVEVEVMNSIVALEAEIESMEEDYKQKVNQQETVLTLLGGRRRSAADLDMLKRIEKSPVFSRKQPSWQYERRHVPLIGRLWATSVAQ